MSTETPALPPRKVATSTQVENEAKTLEDCPCYSPMALLVHLETLQSDHKHVFKRIIIEEKHDEQEPISSSTADDLVETMDLDQAPVAVETTKTFRYICKVCHIWLNVEHSQESAEKCPATDYLCHHYHSQGINGYECCGCQYALSTEIMEPVVSMTVLRRLEATRIKARSFADMMQGKGDQPTLVSTYSTVLIYIQGLLNGVKRNINSINPNFVSRIGLSDGSQALLEDIGFHFKDNFFHAPEIEAGSPAEERLRRLQQEIIVSLDALRQELGSTTVPVIPAEKNMKVKTADMQQLLGIVPSLESRYTSTNEYLNKAYAAFGLTSGATDNLVSWSYQKVINEPSIIIDEYDAMDNLVTITNQTNSVVLQTLVACERSQGKIGRNDIGDAYAYFGVTSDDVDDALLIGLYKLKLSDEPGEKNTHQDKLKTIAIARNSSELIEFLKEEKGITSETVEDTMGVPAHMMNTQRTAKSTYFNSPYHRPLYNLIHIPNRPIGLNNIGNTCYFNSLLQYYYTLLPFRNTMIDIEAYIEDDQSEPKKIGGIEVDEAEIRRAKKFVGLLKELFLNLQQTNQKAISPQLDLAYMALLNEREDEDVIDTAQKEQEASNDTDVKMEIIAESILTNETTEVVDVDMAQAVPVEESVSTEQAATTQADDIQQDAETPADAIQLDDIRSESPPPAYQDITTEVEHLSTKEEKKALTETVSIKPNQRPSVDTMMFGRQQDVSECMGNVMYLVEAALKPLQKTESGEQIDDMIRQTFYGKARQILSYCDNTTLQVVKNEMEEDFSHVIVDASQDKDLYDGLDEYFFEDQVENFQGGRDATREVTVKAFPPILQILVQRVQFDRATSNVYKSNAYIQLEKTIYLDRYSDANFEELRERRMQVAEWRKELDSMREMVNRYTTSKTVGMPIPDLLNATAQALVPDMLSRLAPEEQANLKHVLDLLHQEAQNKQLLIDQSKNNIQALQEKIQRQYSDYTKLAYNLHAVFIHQGQANYGHYWVYIYDHKGDQWWKYNDSLVTKVSEKEILHDTTGSTANPYFLVYVDAAKMDDCVETIKPINA